MPKKAQIPRIYVAAELIRVANPGITLEQSQSAVWDEGIRLLERAIAERRSKLETILDFEDCPN